MASKPCQADDFAGMRIDGLCVGLTGWALGDHRGAVDAARDKNLLLGSLLCGAAHALHKRRVGKVVRCTSLHHTAITHDGNAITGVEHFPKNVADQYDAAANADEAPDELQQLFGNPRVQ